jgi:hypothetical protein
MTGAVFQPEQIELMRSVLGEATVMLPEAKQKSTVKADMASESSSVPLSNGAGIGRAFCCRRLHALFTRHVGN